MSESPIERAVSKALQDAGVKPICDHCAVDMCHMSPANEDAEPS